MQEALKRHSKVQPLGLPKRKFHPEVFVYVTTLGVNVRQTFAALRIKIWGDLRRRVVPLAAGREFCT